MVNGGGGKSEIDGGWEYTYLEEHKVIQGTAQSLYYTHEMSVTLYVSYTGMHIKDNSFG